MHKHSWSVRATVVSIVGTLLIAGSAQATLIGQTVTISSQVNAGPITSEAETVIDPGAEISFGDSNAFDWMVAGDGIDIAPYSNVNAPWQIYIALGATHTFVAGDQLKITLQLPTNYVFGVAAITLANTVNQIVAAKSGDTMTITINDPIEVSQDDAGGAVRLIFQVVQVPEPTTGLAALALCGLGILRRRR